MTTTAGSRRPAAVYAALRPGDIGFTTIAGLTGAGIAAAEKLNDPEVTWDDAKRVQHVVVVTQAADPARGEQVCIVQAMPNGAEEIAIDFRHASAAFVYVRPDYRSEYTAPGVARAARRYVGVPYSFLDYAAIAGRHLLAQRPEQRTPLDRYVSATGHMICSQLADQALADAGFHVFTDKRIPQDVTPAALYHRMLELPHTIIDGSAS
jgi:hypothetical protein